MFGVGYLAIFSEGTLNGLRKKVDYPQGDLALLKGIRNAKHPGRAQTQSCDGHQEGLARRPPGIALVALFLSVAFSPREPLS